MNIEAYKKDRESNKGKTMTSLAMSENGRILIPSAIREQLGFKPNGKIFAEIKDGSLVLTPLAQHYANLRAYFDKHLNVPEGVSLVDELIADRRLEAKREDAGE
jgi:AbrB family looped-hinge helix DNA binding protein